jgi:hypothetical protein
MIFCHISKKTPLQIFPKKIEDKKMYDLGWMHIPKTSGFSSFQELMIPLQEKYSVHPQTLTYGIGENFACCHPSHRNMQTFIQNHAASKSPK